MADKKPQKMYGPGTYTFPGTNIVHISEASAPYPEDNVPFSAIYSKSLLPKVGRTGVLVTHGTKNKRRKSRNVERELKRMLFSNKHVSDLNNLAFVVCDGDQCTLPELTTLAKKYLPGVTNVASVPIGQEADSMQIISQMLKPSAVLKPKGGLRTNYTWSAGTPLWR